jgi:hypothetical protein
MKKPIDLAKVQESDQVLARAKAINPNVRMPEMDELAEITEKRRAGRPKGPEATTTITIRLPESLRERLDRHLDRLETQTGIKANRGEIARHALQRFLDAQEKGR